MFVRVCAVSQSVFLFACVRVCALVSSCARAFVLACVCVCAYVFSTLFAVFPCVGCVCGEGKIGKRLELRERGGSVGVIGSNVVIQRFQTLV